MGKGPGERLPMQHQAGRITWRDALGLFAAVLILRVTADVVLLYRNYFPPDFQADFLLDRRRYFWGPYSWAFYAPIISGPLSLILGILLLSNRFRAAFPDWHRRLGKIQVANVLLFVVPSGLWMARYAITGATAGIGLASMGVATAISCARGSRLVVRQLWRGRPFASTVYAGGRQPYSAWYETSAMPICSRRCRQALRLAASD